MSVAVAGELGIDRDEIIYAANLDAMAGVEHDRDIGVDRRILELADRALEIQIADIVLRHDDVETGVPEHLGHGRRVPFGIG